MEIDWSHCANEQRKMDKRGNGKGNRWEYDLPKGWRRLARDKDERKKLGLYRRTTWPTKWSLKTL